METQINQRILLGITGGIAAYKSAELTRLLKKSGAEVRVVLTPGAREFITPLTLAALSGHKVYTELFDADAEAQMSHIELARWADLVLVAPASANFMSQLVQGAAGDLLTTLCLATTAPIRIAPAMNQKMWENQATQANKIILLDRGVTFIGPDTGEQACGEVGFGRMSEPQTILESLVEPGPLSGKNLLITAGPTREAIDPVRYISNHSSGKMGFELAQAALKAGANVTLVTGPTSLSCHSNIHRIDITSAQNLHEKVMSLIHDQDFFISAAAVADYRPHTISDKKIKKNAGKLNIECEKNPDILASIGALKNKPFTVGFALESDNLIDNATQKLIEKNIDMVIANSTEALYSDDNCVTVITQDKTTEFPKQSKHILAEQLIGLLTT